MDEPTNKTSIRYHKKRDGVFRIEPNGNARFLTFWERVQFAFGARP